jgi:hypothetical protein
MSTGALPQLQRDHSIARFQSFGKAASFWLRTILDSRGVGSIRLRDQFLVRWINVRTSRLKDK